VESVGIVLMVASLVAVTAGIVVVARVGIKMGRGRNRSARPRKTDGEFQPPEPPEGRYWG
jgi:hypothetical protein